ncbi:MAG: CvpA family protein, partial [Oscillospiraceae bacterium]
GAVNGAATADVSALLPGIFNAMPDYLSSVVINTYGSETELIAQIQQQLASGGTSIAITVADNIVRPVFVMLAQALIGLIVFIILSILVGFASRLFKGVNRIPVLGKANEILGGVVGVGQAVIYITLLAVAMSFFVALTSNTNEFINTRVIDQTFIFKHFYNLQILEISVAKI